MDHGGEDIAGAGIAGEPGLGRLRGGGRGFARGFGFFGGDFPFGEGGIVFGFGFAGGDVGLALAHET